MTRKRITRIAKYCEATVAIRSYISCLALLLSLSATALAENPVKESSGRIPWTTSRVTGSPDLPLPYVTEVAFPSLRFNQCLDMTYMPGSDRLFVVEQSGKIFSFPNREDVAQADLAIDFARAIPGVEQVYAIAFHPQFEQNRFCYICYIKKPEQPEGTHVARFRVTEDSPPRIDVSSEQTIVTWLSGGHNGCSLKFGPDGYLYISTGDGSGPNPPDLLRAGQDISNLLSAILRVDVDKPSQGNNYSIPPDNPFVDQKNARGEIWAYGLRNPWRMSFDRKTGDLWVGDVGWELWEMIHLIERGGNYGWSVMEGRQPTNPDWPKGPTPIIPPLIEHPHTESSSITDGLTYYGNRIPALYGWHIYGDYDTGKIWGFRFENGVISQQRELADTTLRIVSFGEAADGEFYLLDHSAGTLNRLVPNPKIGQVADFPRRLSETGIFQSIASLTPSPGVVPYSINAAVWNDHSTSEKLVAVPGANSIHVKDGLWEFPKDSVLVNTLSLEMESDKQTSQRRIETQLLHFDGAEWQPYTYRWNEDQTDAFLVDALGTEEVFQIIDPREPDGIRKQNWRFAGRAECQRCHNKWAGPPLAFNQLQLDRLQSYSEGPEPQLAKLAAIKILDTHKFNPTKRRLCDPADADNELDDRARSYLHVNCAHCHQQHAGSGALAQMLLDLPLDMTMMLDVPPTLGRFGIENAQIIRSKDAYSSVLFYRMSKTGNGHMPIIGPTEVDCRGLALIEEWINGFASESISHNVAEATAGMNRVRAEMVVLLERIYKLSPNNPSTLSLEPTDYALYLMRAIDRGAFSEQAKAAIIQAASQHPDPVIRELFERFLPSSRRTKRAGTSIAEDQILAIPGNAERGKDVFFNTAGVQCKNCHKIDGQGIEVGADLSKIGEKYSRRQILESILAPSKSIDPKYVSYVVETKEGRVIAGLLVKKDEFGVTIKDAMNNVYEIAKDEIEQIATRSQSIMPEQLLRDLTAEQIADLIEYLSHLK